MNSENSRIYDPDRPIFNLQTKLFIQNKLKEK